MLVATLLFAACATAPEPDVDVDGELTGEVNGTETTPTPAPPAPPVVVPVEDRMERHLRLPFPLPHTVIFNPFVVGNELETLRLLSVGLYARVVCPIEQWPIYVLEMAADWPQQMDEAGLVWHIPIEQGWTFDDGTPINAHTYAFSIRAQNNPLLQNRNSNQNLFVGLAEYYMGEGTWEEVTGIRVVDDYTLELTFNESHRPSLGMRTVVEGLWNSPNSPVHPELWERNLAPDGLTTTWGQTPFYPYFMNSGVYRASQYITDQIIQFERNPLYTGPLAEIYTADRISWIVAPDEDVQVMLFENGELDQANANARRFDEHPNLFGYPNGFVYGIFLNSFSETNPILQDVNFRRAMFWSLDRERIVGAAFPTHVPQAFLYPLTTRMRAYDFLETGRQFSLRESEYGQVYVSDRLLDQNGFDPDLALHYFNLAWEANGGVPIVIEMIYSDGGEAEQMWAEAIQHAWQGLFGVERFQVNLRSVPWVVALEQHLFRTMMDYEIMATRRVWMVLDGEPQHNTNWVSDDHRDAWDSQYMILTDDAQVEFDRLLDLAFFANTHSREDRNIRNQAAADIEHLILNDHSFIPMYNHADRLMISPWLQTIMPNGHYSFRLGPWQFVWDDDLHAQMNR
jgi:ABC-type transport system substrate-binding protein